MVDRLNQVHLRIFSTWSGAIAEGLVKALSIVIHYYVVSDCS